MNFKPNGNWVVLPNPAKKKTDSGIILDDATVNKMKTNILKVCAVGPNCLFVVTKELQVFLSFLCSRGSIKPFVDEFNRQSSNSTIVVENDRARIEFKNDKN